MADLALDLQRELVGIEVERKISQMIADVKSIVRRNRAVVEDGKWRLELRRPAGLADQQPLLWIFHQRPFAVVEGQGHGVERERPDRTETGCERRDTGALHHLSSVEHRCFL